jgi:hypothetical protein
LDFHRRLEAPLRAQAIEGHRQARTTASANGFFSGNRPVITN